MVKVEEEEAKAREEAAAAAAKVSEEEGTVKGCEDLKEEGEVVVAVKKRDKIMRVKRVLINWKIVDVSKNSSESSSVTPMELNSLISNKKSVENFPLYKQLKPTNNDQIVTRAYLVLGIKSTAPFNNHHQ